MRVLEVGVVGAGIAGMTTALELQAKFPSARVTLLADKFTKETTSDGAAGIFRPGTSWMGPDPQTTREWIRSSFEYYNDLVGKGCGVSEISGYIFSNFNAQAVRNHLLEGIVPEYRAAREDELSLCPGDWKYGAFFRTLLIECRTFLPWAMQRFEDGGGLVKKRSLSNLRELEGDFDLAVNCSGLGARWLCDDLSLVPIRGQVLKVYAPWVEHFYYGDVDTYVIPGSGGEVTLGGSRHYESLRTEPCRHEAAAILERCTSLLPRLAAAPVRRTWVGLRPHRSPVRVEPEIISNLKVVHNYGHGGYGITSAPGTAQHAVRLVSDLHSTRAKM